MLTSGKLMGAGGVGGGVSSLTFVGTNSGRTGSLAFPTGTQAGDIVICINAWGSTVYVPPTEWPTGFTFLNRATNQYFTGGKAATTRRSALTFSYRVVQAGDSVAGGISSQSTILLFTYRPDSEITNVSAFGSSTQSRTIPSGSSSTATIVFASNADADAAPFSMSLTGADANLSLIYSTGYAKLSALSQDAGSNANVATSSNATYPCAYNGYMEIT